MTVDAPMDPITAARRVGIGLVWDPPGFSGPPEVIAILKRAPDTARELLRRAEVFRLQTRPGWCPLLVLEAAPIPTAGACISCGTAILQGRWRCDLCLHAVELVLDSPFADPPGSPSVIPNSRT